MPSLHTLFRIYLRIQWIDRHDSQSSPYLSGLKGFLTSFVQSYLHEKSDRNHIQNPLCTSGGDTLFLNR